MGVDLWGAGWVRLRVGMGWGGVARGGDGGWRRGAETRGGDERQAGNLLAISRLSHKPAYPGRQAYKLNI